jgi:hypothetical protein
MSQALMQESQLATDIAVTKEKVLVQNLNFLVLNQNNKVPKQNDGVLKPIVLVQSQNVLASNENAGAKATPPKLAKPYSPTVSRC